MGYRVVYSEDRTGPATGRTSFGRIVLLTMVFCLAFLSMVYRFWPEGAEVMDRLRNYEGLNATGTALELMVMQLRSGTDLNDALSAFCRDIMNIGMIYAA